MTFEFACTRPECQGSAGCVCPKSEPAGLAELQHVYPSPAPQPPLFNAFLGDPQLGRIADALERIAKALESDGRHNDR